jgi:hypothetical protein
VDPTTTESVQPSEGQGGASGGAPYGEYLDRIPAELREQVEPVFQAWDGNVTRRFQELSAAGKRWEPFEQAGLAEYDPQSLQQLVQFAQMAEQDPTAYTEWVRGQAEAAGLLTGSQQDQDTYVDPAIERLIEQRYGPLQQQVQQFQSWQQEQELARAQQHHAEQINARLDELARQHGEFPRPTVEKFISQYIGSDPQNAVDRAFADYQQLVAEIEQQVFASKLRVPGTPEVTGAPDAVPQPVTSLREAAAIATERLRQANRT